MNLNDINLSKLREKFDKADFKYGKSSYCFIIDDKIIKVYAKKEDDYPKDVCDLSKYKADTIVFPERYIRENGKIAAEISRYINNKDIMESFNDDALLSVITSGYELLVQDFYAYPDILMADLCPANILFSNELGYHVIDTTEWKIKGDSLKINVGRLNYSLISVIIENLEIPITYGIGSNCNSIDKTFYDNLSTYKTGKRLQECITMIINSRFSFLKLMEALIGIYREYYGTEPETLGDLKEIVKILNKKVDFNII